MPVVLDRSQGARGGGRKQQPAQGVPKRVPSRPREVPLANVPRRTLISSAIVFTIIVIGGLWFLFGYGPEDSGEAMKAVDVAPRPITAQAPASNAGAPAADVMPGAQSSISGAPIAPTFAGIASSAPPAAANSQSINPGSYGAARPEPQLVHVDRAAGPGEYEGLPPTSDPGSEGGTWKPGLPFGAPVRGNASDP